MSIPTNKRFVLIGRLGSGRTTLGNELALNHGFSLVSLNSAAVDIASAVLGRQASIFNDYDLIRSIRDAGSDPALSIVGQAVPTLGDDLSQSPQKMKQATATLFQHLMGTRSPVFEAALERVLYAEPRRIAIGFGGPGFWAYLAQRDFPAMMLDHSDLRIVIDDVLTPEEVKVFEIDDMRIIRVDTSEVDAHARIRTQYQGGRWLRDIQDRWSDAVPAHQVSGTTAAHINARMLLGLPVP